MGILPQQEGFGLDPKGHFPVTMMAGAGPTPERAWAIPFSEAPPLFFNPPAPGSVPKHSALDLLPQGRTHHTPVPKGPA